MSRRNTKHDATTNPNGIVYINLIDNIILHILGSILFAFVCHCFRNDNRHLKPVANLCFIVC